MEELLDELRQGIEGRVHQLSLELEARKQDGKSERSEQSVNQMNRIFEALTEEDRQFLDELLMERRIIYEEEKIWFYRSGLADALDILRYLRKM